VVEMRRSVSSIRCLRSAKICTSHIEGQNLTIRMRMRRLTRLTNGFSRKWENLRAAYCLHFAYYNFCRIHKRLHVTPPLGPVQLPSGA